MVHWKTDQMHSQRAYEIVDKYARAPEVQKECLTRVGRATEMRWLFTDGIYRTFVDGGGNGH
jgi:pyrroloquinoline-quinone synthase